MKDIKSDLAILSGCDVCGETCTCLNKAQTLRAALNMTQRDIGALIYTSDRHWRYIESHDSLSRTQLALITLRTHPVIGERVNTILEKI